MMTNEELFALIKKNPISVGCAVLSLALGAGIYFRSGLVPAATEELTKKSDEGQRLAANLQNAAQLKEQLETLEACTKELNTRLVHAGQPLTNYQYFYKLESETGAKLMSISGGTIVAGPKGGPKLLYSGVPFAITITGTLNQNIDYLRRLENGVRYCRIMSVTGSVPPADRACPMSLNLNLELLGLP
jgi:hypothetical protein